MNPKKILVTGASGMLGKDLVQALTSSFSVYGMVQGRDERPNFFECDVANRSLTIKSIERVNPSIVIHAAAMTDVEGCELDRKRAMLVNFEGTKNVVDGARHVKALMIYISTDFVFSGNSNAPYKESQVPHPATAYGESKLLGEFYTRDQSDTFLVIRTSWTYGLNGANFMTKIMSQIENKQELLVVHDQKGSPTYTKDLAFGIAEMLKKIQTFESKNHLNAIYHVTNSGSASRYEIALELVKNLGLLDVKIQSVDSDHFKSIVKRPLNSVLDNSRFVSSFGIQMRPWKEALKDYVSEIKSKPEVLKLNVPRT